MIVVTTPTGTIGGHVLQGLLDRDAPVRAIARDPARLPAQAKGRVELVQGSHGDPGVVTAAFAGADTVFWLVPPDYRTDSIEASYVDFTRPACEAIVGQEVRRVVVVSALGRGSAVAHNAGVVTASLAMRDLIAKTGVNYRALTPSSFMSNLLTQVEPIKHQGTFFDVPAADRKLPLVAPGDIAAAAVDLLLDDSWTEQGDVPVLGPEDLSGNDMADIMSQVLARPIRYQQIPGEAFKAELLRNGMSDAMAQGLLDMRQAKDQGLDDAESGAARANSPTSFRQWCEETLKPAVLS